jgi:SAM-dependent methyltransferase
MIKSAKVFLSNINRLFKLFGIDIIKFFKTTYGIKFYLENLIELRRQKKNDNNFYFGKLYPVLDERFSDAGTMSGHYFHQDLHVAKLIFEKNPKKHLDIGSRIDGFVAHVAVYRSIDIIDVRDQKSDVENISFRKADLMELPNDLINYYDSISSLHAIEHFGLGRYGDPIDYYGFEKAINNISKLLEINGHFYFSVPIGPQRIEFNAHRVFSIKNLILLLEKHFIVNNFSYVDDNGNFFKNIELVQVKINNNCGCIFGCGIFDLIKK